MYCTEVVNYDSIVVTYSQQGLVPTEYSRVRSNILFTSNLNRCETYTHTYTSAPKIPKADERGL